ncbi:MAG: stage III sporulation protein AB [Firmicutes bacterium]|nr:stage III sporulation protein AB [Bacillota bacterium]
MLTLKAAGAVLALTAAVLYGLLGLLLLKRRQKTIKELTRAVIYITSGIEFSQKPMTLIFNELAARNTGAVGSMFQSLADGLSKRQNCAELWALGLDKLLFSAEERDIFMPLGACLGMTDKSIQLKTAEMLLSDAREYEKRLNEQIEKYKASDLRLRIMCGIITVILFV